MIENFLKVFRYIVNIKPVTVPVDAAALFSWALCYGISPRSESDTVFTLPELLLLLAELLILSVSKYA